MNIEDLCMEKTLSLEDYLKVLKYENILGQNDKQIKCIEDLCMETKFKNIRVV